MLSVKQNLMETVYESCIIDGTRNLRKLSKFIFDRIIPLHLNIMKIYYKLLKKIQNIIFMQNIIL